MLVDLVMQGKAKFDVIATVEELLESDASIIAEEISELNPIGIWVGGKLVAYILTKDQSDVQNILKSGLPFLAKFSAVSKKGILSIHLIDPDTQLEL